MFTAKRSSFIFSTFQTRRDSRDGCFWPEREEEDSRASHKRRQTNWNLARGGNVVRAGHRLGVGGWEGDREGGLTIRRDFTPLSSSLSSTRYVCLVENVKDIFKMFTKCLNIHYIYKTDDTRVVHRRLCKCARTGRRSGTAHHRRRRQTSWNFARVGKDESWPSSRRWHRGCSSGVVKNQHGT